jgi:hypothetical protein
MSASGKSADPYGRPGRAQSGHSSERLALASFESGPNRLRCPFRDLAERVVCQVSITHGRLRLSMTEEPSHDGEGHSIAHVYRRKRVPEIVKPHARKRCSPRDHAPGAVQVGSRLSVDLARDDVFAMAGEGGQDRDRGRRKVDVTSARFAEDGEQRSLEDRCLPTLRGGPLAGARPRRAGGARPRRQTDRSVPFSVPGSSARACCSPSRDQSSLGSRSSRLRGSRRRAASSPRA